MPTNKQDLLQHLQAAAKHYGSSILSRKQYIRYRLHYAAHAPTVQRITRHFESWHQAVSHAGLQDGFTAKRLRCLQCGQRYYLSSEGTDQHCDACAAQPKILLLNRSQERIVQALRMLHESLGYVPTTSDYRTYLVAYPQAPLPSISSVYRQCGTWTHALQLAGIASLEQPINSPQPTPHPHSPTKGADDHA